MAIPRKKQQVGAAVDAPTPSISAEAGVDYEVFTSPSGTSLYQTRDGAVFNSVEEVNLYLAQNQVEIRVNEFMAHVEENQGAYFGDKDGNMPAEFNERALLAQKTRLRNSALKVLAWHLSHQ